MEINESVVPTFRLLCVYNKVYENKNLNFQAAKLSNQSRTEAADSALVTCFILNYTVSIQKTK